MLDQPFLSGRKSNTVITGNEVWVGPKTTDFDFSKGCVSDMAIAVGDPNQLGHFVTFYIGLLMT